MPSTPRSPSSNQFNFFGSPTAAANQASGSRRSNRPSRNPALLTAPASMGSANTGSATTGRRGRSNLPPRAPASLFTQPLTANPADPLGNNYFTPLLGCPLQSTQNPPTPQAPRAGDADIYNTFSTLFSDSANSPSVDDPLSAASLNNLWLLPPQPADQEALFHPALFARAAPPSHINTADAVDVPSSLNPFLLGDLLANQPTIPLTRKPPKIDFFLGDIPSPTKQLDPIQKAHEVLDVLIENSSTAARTELFNDLKKELDRLIALDVSSSNIRETVAGILKLTIPIITEQFNPLKNTHKFLVKQVLGIEEFGIGVALDKKKNINALGERLKSIKFRIESLEAGSNQNAQNHSIYNLNNDLYNNLYNNLDEALSILNSIQIIKQEAKEMENLQPKTLTQVLQASAAYKKAIQILGIHFKLDGCNIMQQYQFMQSTIEELELTYLQIKGAIANKQDLTQYTQEYNQHLLAIVSIKDEVVKDLKEMNQVMLNNLQKPLREVNFDIHYLELYPAILQNYKLILKLIEDSEMDLAQTPTFRLEACTFAEINTDANAQHQILQRSVNLDEILKLKAIIEKQINKFSNRFSKYLSFINELFNRGHAIGLSKNSKVLKKMKRQRRVSFLYFRNTYLQLNRIANTLTDGFASLDALRIADQGLTEFLEKMKKREEIAIFDLHVGVVKYTFKQIEEMG